MLNKENVPIFADINEVKGVLFYCPSHATKGEARVRYDAIKKPPLPKAKAENGAGGKYNKCNKESEERLSA